MPKSIRSPAHKRLLEVLVETRHKAGLTQAELAARLGRPQSFVAKCEKGERRLDVVEFVEFVQAMDAEPRRVFGRLLVARKPN